MQYTPRQEREIRDSMLLSPGEYDFEVLNAKEAVSKSNNDMIAMELKVFCEDGTTRQVKDWLVPGSDLGDLKLNRFSHATGLQDVFFAGELTAIACVGAAGRLRLGIQSDPNFGDQNTVKGYVVPTFDSEESQVELRPPAPVGVPASQTKAAMQASAARNENGPPANDDIPF